MPDTNKGLYEMKKLVGVIVCSFVFMSGCTSVELIGEVNMISNRNVDTKTEYTRLTSYSGGSKRQIKNARSESINDAVAKTVKETPGGEYLMNAKIYFVKGKYYAVEGDVWGVQVKEGNYQGFRLGDKVMWKSLLGGYNYGVIVAIKDSEKCVVEDSDGHMTTIRFDKLMRSVDNNEGDTK